MINIAGILLKLPDGQVILNRRGKAAPVSAGLLALYGGHIEQGETPVEAASRELLEETSIKFNLNDLVHLFDFKISAEGRPRKFYVFELKVDSQNFAVYEGKGSEVYKIEDVLIREDLAPSLRKTLKLVRQKDGA